MSYTLSSPIKFNYVVVLANYKTTIVISSNDN